MSSSFFWFKTFDKIVTIEVDGPANAVTNRWGWDANIPTNLAINSIQDGNYTNVLIWEES